MRLFNRTVYQDTQYGTTRTFTASEHHAGLGAAEKLGCHVRVKRVSGTSPTLTLGVWSSNDGQEWDIKANILAAAALSTTAESTFMAIDDGSTPNGAFVRLSVELGASDNLADVLVVACGRGEQRAG